MAISFEALSGTLRMDVSQWTKALNEAKATVNAFRESARVAMDGVKQAASAVGDAAKKMGQDFKNAATAAMAAGAAASGAMVSMASEAEEAASKFKIVFGDAAERTGASIDQFAKAAGRSKFELRSMAGDLGALLGPMGFSRQRTGELSDTLVRLTTDLSSFHNVAERDVMTALRSGLVGESEPLRRLGVQLSEAKIQAEAFALGLAKTKEEVAGAIKAEAIMSIVLRETAAAHGDAIRTSGGFANSLRALKAAFGDAAREIGSALLPAATRIVQVFREVIVANQQAITKFAQFLAEQVTVERVQKVWESFWKTVDGFRDSVLNLAAAFESRVSQPLERMRENVNGLRQAFSAWFDALPQGVQDVLKVAFGLQVVSTAASALSSIPIIGPFLASFGSLISPLGLLSAALTPLVTLFVSFKSAIIGAFSSLAATVGAPVTIVVGAVTALGSILAVAYANSLEVRNAFAAIAEKALELGGIVWHVATEIWGQLVKAFNDNKENIIAVGELLAKIGRIMATMFVDNIKVAVPIILKLVEAFIWGFSRVADVVGFASDVLTGKWNKALSAMLTGLINVMEMFAGAIDFLPDAMIPGDKEGVAKRIQDIREWKLEVDMAAKKEEEARNKVAAAEAKQHSQYMGNIRNRLFGWMDEAAAAAEFKKKQENATASADRTLAGSIAGKEAENQQRMKEFENRVRNRPRFEDHLPGRGPRQQIGPPADLPVGEQLAAQRAANADVGHAGPNVRGGNPAAPAVSSFRSFAAAVRQQVGEEGGRLTILMQEIFGRVDQLARAKGTEFQQLLMSLHGEFDAAIATAAERGATLAQRGQLVNLRREIISTMQLAARSTGEAKQAAVERLVELQAAWAKTFDAIGKKTKEQVAAVGANIEKELGKVREAVGQVAAGAGGRGAGQSSQTASAGGGGGGGFFAQQPNMLQRFGMAMDGVRQQFGGIMDAGARFNAFLNAQVDPIARIDHQVGLLRAQMGGLEINMRNFGTRGSILDTYRGMQNQIAQLLRQRGEIENEQRAVALGFFRRRQASINAERGRRAEEGQLIEPIRTFTGGLPAGSRSAANDLAGTSRGQSGAGDVSQSFTNHFTFSEATTPDAVRRLADALEKEMNRRGRDSFGRSLIRS